MAVQIPDFAEVGDLGVYESFMIAIYTYLYDYGNKIFLIWLVQQGKSKKSKGTHNEILIYQVFGLKFTGKLFQPACTR